jgi:hypothetical protein
MPITYAMTSVERLSLAGPISEQAVKPDMKIRTLVKNFSSCAEPIPGEELQSTIAAGLR